MIEIRQATEKDIDIIFNFIKELAIYEKLENDVTATEDLILETLFKNDKADVLIAIMMVTQLVWHYISTHILHSWVELVYI